ncbi:MAG: Ig-like domain-containing protein [Candidatus Micrarchaeaceae archaeon]
MHRLLATSFYEKLVLALLQHRLNGYLLANQPMSKSTNFVENKPFKLQSAMEFMLTYTWMFLLLLLFSVIFYFFFLSPYVLAPNSCTFSNGVQCSALFIATNSAYSTEIGVLAVNEQPIALLNPKMTVSTNGVNSTVDCMPDYVPTGGAILCIVPIKTNTAINSFLSGKLSLNAVSCNLLSNPPSDLSKCNLIIPQSYYAEFSGHAVLMPSESPTIKLTVENKSWQADGSFDGIYATVRIFGNPVKGVVVAFATNSPNAHISTPYSTTNALGIASSSISDASDETVNVTATFANITSSANITFNKYVTLQIYPDILLSATSSPIFNVGGIAYAYKQYIPINVTQNCDAYTLINFANTIYVSNYERLVFSGVSVNGVEAYEPNVTISECSNTLILPHYTTQYYLSEDASPSSGIVEPGSNWFDSGEVIQISATPVQGWLFSNWQGSGPGSYSGASSSNSISMLGPIAETAVFYTTSTSSTISSTTTSTTTSTTSTTSSSTTAPTTSIYLYCIGGYSGNAVNSTYYTSLQGDTQAWVKTTSYPIKVYAPICTAFNGYAYCIGGIAGNKATNLAYYAPISSNGIGAWVQTASYPSAIAKGSCMVMPLQFGIITGIITCMGGSAPNSYYALLQADGNLFGNWQVLAPDSTSSPSSGIFAGGSIFEGYITAFFMLPKFFADSNLPDTGWQYYLNAIPAGTSCVFANEQNNTYQYCIGGGTATVRYMEIGGKWQASAYQYPSNIMYAGCISSN